MRQQPRAKPAFPQWSTIGLMTNAQKAIHVLSDHLASQIAAGEVVERPFSVVKELVENSIDAGATTITIDVRGGGRELIQVADNGGGIAAGEIETAFLRHATSKLNSVEDLQSIRTLGFRGEALASIAAVSHVTIASRAAGEEAGTRLILEGGQTIRREHVGAPQGTVIAVEHLFYNVPARLKFLKSIGTEKRLIDEFVTRYALAYPGIRFRLTHDNRVTIQTTGSGRLADVLLAVYGPDTVRQLLRVGPDGAAEPQTVEADVAGVVSDPGMNWANRGQINLFVNGRWVRDARLTFAVVQAYHTLLPVGRYPMALLFLTLPPEEVDVNVHPTKVEVRFRNEGSLFGVVQKAVRQTLLGTTAARDVGVWPGAFTAPHERQSWAGPDRPAFAPLEEVAQSRMELSWGGAGVDEEDETAAGPAVPLRVDRPTGDGRLPIMRVVGQVGAAYIITEGPDGLYLIDQHAAHERVLFEQFMAARARQDSLSQPLVAGAALYLSPSQMHLVEEHQSLLSGLGFQVEPFGPNAVQVRAVPALLSGSDPAAALLAVVEDLEGDRRPMQREIEARVVRRVCKTAAVKAGQVLSRPEMESLVAQLEACETPHTCPHGRPTLIHLSAAQLARQFGRT